MKPDYALLTRFLRDYPFQPATGVWRAFEIEHLCSFPFPQGHGLDLGCGDGKLTKIILDQLNDPPDTPDSPDSPPGSPKRTLVGIDPDPKETELAKEIGIYERIHTVGGGGIPEPDASFDWVLSNSVLEHIPDLEPVFAEVGRLLKPGGVFIYTVPSEQFHDALKGPAFGGDAQKRATYLKELDTRVAHLRYFSPDDWSALLGRHGMTLERATRYLTKKETRRWESIARVTAGVLFAMHGKGTHPIEIQRKMGMHKKDQRMPTPIAKTLARVLGAGLGENGSTGDADKGPHGCLMVMARKS